VHCCGVSQHPIILLRPDIFLDSTEGGLLSRHVVRMRAGDEQSRSAPVYGVRLLTWRPSSQRHCWLTRRVHFWLARRAQDRGMQWHCQSHQMQQSIIILQTVGGPAQRTGAAGPARITNIL